MIQDILLTMLIIDLRTVEFYFSFEVVVLDRRGDYVFVFVDQQAGVLDLKEALLPLGLVLEAD